jgi:SAM-dependent MidA family methyltransferase
LANPLSTGNPELCRLISQRISQHPLEQITFAEFMDTVLYHPQQGYYTSQPKIGRMQADFLTSPHLGADFGELLAVQLGEMWQRLGNPAPFTLVEMGAGQGLLAAQVLNSLQQQNRACFATLEYVIVEKSAKLIEEQRERLQPWLERGVQVSWRPKLRDTIAPITGCIFSNELVDAFPVHQIIIHQGQLHEVYLTASGADASQPWGETIDVPSTPRLVEYFDWLGISLCDYPDGYRTEVNLAALDWLPTLSEQLDRGYVLTIDYGYPAHRYYSRQRSQGTLQCYYQHAHHNDPYLHIGEQDITAHVDFTALQKAGDRCGLVNLGLTPQGLFLMALGLGDRLAALSQSTTQNPQEIQQLLQRRDNLHRLIDPMGLGNFQVLIQGKGLTTPEQQNLTGLMGSG